MKKKRLHRKSLHRKWGSVLPPQPHFRCKRTRKPPIFGVALAQAENVCASATPKMDSDCTENDSTPLTMAAAADRETHQIQRDRRLSPCTASPSSDYALHLPKKVDYWVDTAVVRSTIFLVLPLNTINNIVMPWRPCCRFRPTRPLAHCI